MNIVLAISILTPSVSQSQDENFTPKLKEFFKQKKLNKRYIYEYIITSVVKRGIQAKMHSQSKKSLGKINNHKTQNFLEDAGFIERLSGLPPMLSESPYLITTLSIENSIMKYFQATKKLIRSNTELITDAEGNYYLDAFDNLLDFVDQDIDQLFMVIVGNDLTMSDNERLTRLKDLAEKSTQKQQFAQMLYARTVTLVEDRRSQFNELQLKSNINDYEN
ncbi:MAG TPA: hypothetical protein ENH91_07960 [Leeuwenhoekiella sp.]|nr:hypothetical protein [Leeuwenhoekiella sp.]